jgi:hypothetical protein
VNIVVAIVVIVNLSHGKHAGKGSMIGCMSGWVLGGVGVALKCGIRFDALDKYNFVEGDRSFVIFEGDFLFTARQIALPGVPTHNSGFVVSCASDAPMQQRCKKCEDPVS